MSEWDVRFHKFTTSSYIHTSPSNGTQILPLSAQDNVWIYLPSLMSFGGQPHHHVASRRLPPKPARQTQAGSFSSRRKVILAHFDNKLPFPSHPSRCCRFSIRAAIDTTASEKDSL